MNRLVLVTGPPGAGKTTLAPALARELGMPLIMKDTIKEALHDGLGRGPLTLEQSQNLGRATFEVIWAVTAFFPEVVLECNFRWDSEPHRERLIALHPCPVEVFCRCPPVLASSRYRERHLKGGRHPVHVLDEISPSDLERFEPLGLGPVIEIDTTTVVDVAPLASQIRAMTGDLESR